MRKRIDLNCDLGEWRTANGADLDEAIMPFISSCNVACGGHIGDQKSMQITVELARKYGVAIGAHPGYPDKENFGREVMQITPGELSNSLKSQILSLKRITEEAGSKLHHIKPHGALYNHAAKDEETAVIVLSVIKSISPEMLVYLPENSVSGSIAKELGLQVAYEVFADRAYEDDLSLRSRKLEGAVLKDETKVTGQLRAMILTGKVITHSGLQKPIKAETVCLHSDTEGAVQLAQKIHEFLISHGVEITAA